MRKNIHLIFLILSALIPFAKGETILKAPFFYKITGNNIDPLNPVYLLGTCHSLSPNDYDNEIRDKIENSEILISEFPEYSTQSTRGKHRLNHLNFVYNKFLQQDLHWFQEQFVAIGLSPDEIQQKLELIQKERINLYNTTFYHTLFNQFTEKEKRIIAEITLEAGINLLSIHPGILWFLIYHISEASLDKKHLEDSFEVHLIKLFQENQKEIVFLDTLETLLWAEADEFAEHLEWNTDKQISSIKYVIGTWKQSFWYTKDCWRPQEYADASNIDGMIAKNVSKAIQARNLAWRKKVLKALDSGKATCIITGHGHLENESGFLNFFKSQGYTIIRI